MQVENPEGSFLNQRRDAMLLIGPTGSGKTPLGQYAEQHGVHGRTCLHFDFGCQLRAASEGDGLERLTPEDVRLIRELLVSGRLLEDETFYIAEALLEGFLRRHASNACVLLNGLPRHEHQARRLQQKLNMRGLIHLRCPLNILYERIFLNRGGDRNGRNDDHPETIGRKLQIFEERTIPLLAFYRRQGVPIIDLAVDNTSSPAVQWQEAMAALGLPFTRKSFR